MSQIRCPYCHRHVDQAAYADHVAGHQAIRSDGQQADYVTLPEEDREDGDLTGVPRSYRHRRCGAVTGMPEEIIRSYLKNPHLYGADQTFCCGCGGHVPLRECVWIETGEDLQTYTDRLRRAKPLPPLHDADRPSPVRTVARGCLSAATFLALILGGAALLVYFASRRRFSAPDEVPLAPSPRTSRRNRLARYGRKRAAER